VVGLHDVGHPTNILQLCRPDASDTLSYKRARTEMLSALEQYEGLTMHQKLGQCFKIWRGEAQLSDLIHECNACEKK
ncbi:hypothetical protein PENTCL1PPCAC_24204, partial [Pristionchus entomophagus]